ncbi:hypothetical protein STRDD11_02074 [Streptococcus sp. DD11]|uniref:hypothetical protein n=1 Tax=Streptococcus sp. DD11 TaxID=1777879 RepID=UPI000795C701|nr:hypothetical protein [Streptococcus sp. DD11]KXT81247.1 hypothetical protein STRDD11_02074 [Streptococcus sp. DD11]
MTYGCFALKNYKITKRPSLKLSLSAWQILKEGGCALTEAVPPLAAAKSVPLTLPSGSSIHRLKAVFFCCFFPEGSSVCIGLPSYLRFSLSIKTAAGAFGSLKDKQIK